MLMRQQRELVLCDVDGTLADVRQGRAKYIWGREKPDYEGFHTYGTTIAPPIADTVDYLRQHRRAGRRIVIISGRHEKWLEPTRAWLDQHDVPYDDLHLRPAGFKGDDAAAKWHIWHEHVDGAGHVVQVFDDRPKVIERVWQILGYCVHVVPGWDLIRDGY